MFNFIRRLFTRSTALRQATARSKALADQRTWLEAHQGETRERLRRQRHVIALGQDMERRAESEAGERAWMREFQQTGFTLIEAMIVVAILGLLAAIAVPQYLTYATKAKVSEAINLSNAVTTAANVVYETAGVWPQTNVDAQISAPLAGKYGETVGMDGSGNLIVTFGTTSITPPELQGDVIYMSAWVDTANPSGAPVWFCGNLAGAPIINGAAATSLGGATDGKVTTVAVQYLPKNCAGSV